jgi:hypothetical protein
VFLRFGKIRVPVRIDIHHRSLREQRPATNQSCAKYSAKNNALFCCHENSLRKGFTRLGKWAEVISLT